MTTLLQKLRLTGRSSSEAQPVEHATEAPASSDTNGNGHQIGDLNRPPEGGGSALDGCPSPVDRFPLLRRMAVEEVTDPEVKDMVTHIHACPICSQELESLRALGLHYYDSAARKKPHDDV